MKSIALLLIWVGCAVSYPYAYYPQSNGYYRPSNDYWQRPRRAPVQRTMLFGGYYRPLFAGRGGYEPETAMTAFASGNSVAAGSYLGETPQNCLTCPDRRGPPLIDLSPPTVGESEDKRQEPDFFVPDDRTPSTVTNSAFELDEQALTAKPSQDASPAEDADLEPASEPEATTVKPKPAKKRPAKKPRKPVRKEEEDDAEEEDDEEWLPGSRSRRPYGAFFPMFFGYGGRGRSGEGGDSPGVTAVANSYSTGKGGVATSHATAYGGPPPSKSKN